MYFYLLISKGFIIIIIIIIIIISHYSSLRPGSNVERTKELFRLTQMIQVRFLIQTSKFISRPQFTFTMYNGPQCLPVKKNYNNLCFRFVRHMRSSTLETKPLHSRNSHVSHSTQISGFKRRPFHVGLVPERLDV